MEHGFDHRSAAGAARRAARVLVADGDDDVRRLLGATLRRGWFDVVSVGTGAEALDLLRARPFDALVLDAALPVVDGMTVCRWVRSRGPDRSLPTLLLSGEDRPTLHAEASAAGGSAHLCRPVDPRMVRTWVVAAVRYGVTADLPGAASSVRCPDGFVRPRLPREAARNR